ncbi:MAG: bifunctional diaminohydroxyphosphoribosylaminopyrimidine deaminase/5-amino-6-(5-phosphoribosylamino)uracil reductase RibD [Bacteroidales bacterium]|jgi:diaminohydroxyphosphoribosylaminopyrimidine deaminase/5-amino-6-(5-phosphoribosylamino)uracil reductase|nr:bifunctional diaminohydroxyphosphoribosylaminopyrimidine deaminase/5-amino-6-(5-phosphoribosylamino)uracil reductase RibD [Bacteroidales bacterium]
MSDNDYMRMCFALAEKGLNNVSPNPRVGAVIVSGKSKIIGEGFHREYGKAHAEVNAIEDARLRLKSEANNTLKTSTIYVNLEPCSHYGKTPPCADLIIECGIPRVVISCCDPNPRVNGNGIEKLRNAGIEVITGVLEQEGRWINRRFFTRIEKHRPYIILKWAQTADGFMPSTRITSDKTQEENHFMRANEDAIMVGTNTLLHDNPQLNNRLYNGGKNPLRISFDLNERVLKTLETSATINFFDGTSPTLIFTTNDVKYPNAETEIINSSEPILPQVMQALYARNINSLIVEGGANLLQSFIDNNLWDEICIFEANTEELLKLQRLRRASAEMKERTEVRDRVSNEAQRRYLKNLEVPAPKLPINTKFYNQHTSDTDTISRYIKNAD